MNYTRINQDAVKHGKIPKLFPNQNKGMRDPGWYWVRYAIGTPWECAYFTEYGRWDIHGRSDRADNYFLAIGPKIEEPDPFD